MHVNLHYYIVTAQWRSRQTADFGVVATMPEVAAMQVSMSHPELEIVRVNCVGDVDHFHEAEQAATMPRQLGGDGRPLVMMAEVVRAGVRGPEDTGQMVWVRVPNNCTVHPGDAATLIRIRELLHDLSLEYRACGWSNTRFLAAWEEQFAALLHWSERLDG